MVFGSNPIVCEYGASASPACLSYFDANLGDIACSSGRLYIGRAAVLFTSRAIFSPVLAGARLSHLHFLDCAGLIRLEPRLRTGA